MDIVRKALLQKIRTSLARIPVTVLTGPRQAGNTTVAREFLSEESPNYFDLEDPVSLARLAEPRIALEPLNGLVVIDEIQRRPDPFPVLRVLADRRKSPIKFLILGSASGELLRHGAESLAGRMERIEIGGFTLTELGADAADRLWRRGGFPRAYLVANERDSIAWRKQFIQTLLERDFPQLVCSVPAILLLRFWTMVAHYHGQIWSAADPTRALGVSPSTTRRDSPPRCALPSRTSSSNGSRWFIREPGVTRSTPRLRRSRSERSRRPVPCSSSSSGLPGVWQ